MKIKISNNSIYFKINNNELTLLIQKKYLIETLTINNVNKLLYFIGITNSKLNINKKLEIQINKIILKVSIYDLIKLNKYKIKKGIQIYTNDFITIYIQKELKDQKMLI